MLSALVSMAETIVFVFVPILEKNGLRDIAHQRGLNIQALSAVLLPE